jgi:hypothetical protein
MERVLLIVIFSCDFVYETSFTSLGIQMSCEFSLKLPTEKYTHLIQNGPRVRRDGSIPVGGYYGKLMSPQNGYNNVL